MSLRETRCEPVPVDKLLAIALSEIPCKPVGGCLYTRLLFTLLSWCCSLWGLRLARDLPGWFSFSLTILPNKTLLSLSSISTDSFSLCLAFFLLCTCVRHTILFLLPLTLSKTTIFSRIHEYIGYLSSSRARNNNRSFFFLCFPIPHYRPSPWNLIRSPPTYQSKTV